MLRWRPVRATSWFCGVFSLLSAFAGCATESGEDGDDPRGDLANTAPRVELTALPTSGLAPLTVTLSAQVADDDSPDRDLVVRWDFDGAGVWDTEYAARLEGERAYDLGTYRPRVEVRDPEGLTSVATLGVDILVTDSTEPRADLRADHNRDGQIDIADEVGEDAYTQALGAIFLANLDDDDDDGQRDSLDSALDGTDDLVDLTRLRVGRIPALEAADSVTITAAPAEAASRVRIFAPQGAGWTSILAPGEPSGTVPSATLSTSDLALLLEGRTGRSASWDGVLTLTLAVHRAGAVLHQDSVQLRVAPTIFPDNTQPAEVLYVMKIDQFQYGINLPFYDTVKANMPSSVPLYPVDEVEYEGDRWVQDNMQLGYQEVPSAAGAHRLRTFLQTERAGGGLEALVPFELLGPDTGFTYPGGTDTSLNYGGNIEVAPPHDGHPLGRMLIGGGTRGLLDGTAYTDRMSTAQRGWIEAQEVQGPPVEVSSEWLAVGHIDEIFQFIPDPSAANDKPYKLVIASPSLAMSALVQLQSAGRGAAVVFDGRETETTVAAILNDDGLVGFNEAAQARIDTVRDALAAALDLDDADIIDLPVLYEPVSFGGEFAAALNPGVQNLITVDDTLFIPDPEGPASAAGDVWKAQIDAALAPLGVTWFYVDVFESYHLLMGEAHCGANVEQAPYAAAFWEL
jgi:protein-arginine deiminase